MLTLIRQQPTKSGKASIAALVVDILKWNIIDAGSMGVVRRAVTRMKAKADAEYEKPVPTEIL